MLFIVHQNTIFTLLKRETDRQIERENPIFKEHFFSHSAPGQANLIPLAISELEDGIFIEVFVLYCFVLLQILYRCCFQQF